MGRRSDDSVEEDEDKSEDQACQTEVLHRAAWQLEGVIAYSVIPEESKGYRRQG